MAMKSRLTPIQLEYVLDHISHHAEPGPGLRQLISYGDAPSKKGPSIFFPASDLKFDLDKVIQINEVPVLYPVAGDPATSPGSFYIFREKSLYFHHDLLKSIFHLLSGYEEVNSGAADQYGRFPYVESIQFKLGIVDKPVVNYYMEIILSGFRQFCERNAIPFRENPVFKGPVLMLSHDIDLIDSYSFHETAFKFKQLLGLADSPFNLKGKFRDAFTALSHFLNPFSGKNPFWSFPNLLEWESERDFRSSWYFLEKDGKYDNSRYRFHHNRIRKLIEELSSKGHEIGLHGTMQSYDNLPALSRTLEHLRAVSPEPVSGIRQHYLRFRPNHTARIQAEAGLEYDASLGFAEHEGFRNSYCWPFKFFDFEKHCAMDHWEIPLTLMDVTHFRYRRLTFEQSVESFERLAGEVVRFNGIFSLLWHNSFFDEFEFPGITEHYTGLLDRLKAFGMEGITGREIFNRMKLREAGGDQILRCLR
jgi:hypothetical protein